MRFAKKIVAGLINSVIATYQPVEEDLPDDERADLEDFKQMAKIMAQRKKAVIKVTETSNLVCLLILTVT